MDPRLVDQNVSIPTPTNPVGASPYGEVQVAHQAPTAEVARLSNPYEQLLAQWRAMGRPMNDSPEMQQAFNAWTSQIMNAVGVGSWEELPADVFQRVDPANPTRLRPGTTTVTGTPAPSMFAQYSDLAQAYTAAKATNPNLTEHDFAVQWANAHPDDPRLDDPKFLSTLELETDAGTEMPAEQVLLNEALRRGGVDMAADADRQALAKTLLASYQPTLDGSRQTIAGIYDGSLLKSEYAANDEATAAQNAALATQMGQRQSGLDAQVAARKAALDQQMAARQAGLDAQLATRGTGIDTQMATRQAALEKAMRDYYLAQDPVNAARLNAAASQGTAINLAAQAERDRVMAGAARDGYIGSGSGTDAALFRASLAGRQGAAALLGQAKLDNATDIASIGRYGAGEQRGLTDYGAGERRGLTDYGANERRGLVDYGAGEGRAISDFGASEQRGLTDFGAGEGRSIADASAGRRLGFFSNDVSRRLNSLALPSTALQSEFNVRNAADDYGQSGFNRTMRGLGYFRTNGGNAPSTQTYQQPANDAWGSTLNSVGAGLTSAAGNAAIAWGKSRNWGSNTGSGTTGSPSTFDSEALF